MYIFIHLVDCVSIAYRLLIDCLLIAHAHDVSQGMGRRLSMTWAKTWAFRHQQLSARPMFRSMSWEIPGPCFGSRHGHGQSNSNQ